MQIGPLGDGIVYILAWFWSRDSQVRKSPPHRKSLKYSHTHTLRRKHTDGPQKSSHNTALVVCLVCLGVSEVCVCCVFACELSRTSPQVFREDWGCQAQTSAACVSPPGPGAAKPPSPPETGQRCPRLRIPAGTQRNVWAFCNCSA